MSEPAPLFELLSRDRLPIPFVLVLPAFFLVVGMLRLLLHKHLWRMQWFIDGATRYALIAAAWGAAVAVLAPLLGVRSSAVTATAVAPIMLILFGMVLLAILEWPASTYRTVRDLVRRIRSRL